MFRPSWHAKTAVLLVSNMCNAPGVNKFKHQKGLIMRISAS